MFLEPTVDGDYITDILSVALLHGDFDPTIPVISSHNSDEGFVYTDPNATNSSALLTYLSLYFPAAKPEILEYISTTLYPPTYDGSEPYTTPLQRLDLLISEMMIGCNSRYISTAKGNQTWNYMFSIPPGRHGADVAYTFYDEAVIGQGNDAVANATVAKMMQRYIMGFVVDGDPNTFEREDCRNVFPMYGNDALVVNFNKTFVDVREDTMKNAR